MGFNIKFVVGPVPKDLICPLCRGVLVDPLIMYPCQHTLCSSCLKALRPVLHLLKACPLCKSQLLYEPSFAPGNIISRLLNLRVKCHRECGHQCELSALPGHVLNECKFGTIECPNKIRGCHKELARKKMDAHVAECEFRLVICEGCKVEMVYSRLPLHQKRRRCVEGKLMTQRARSAATAMKQVREHQEDMRREVITLEGQLTRLRSSKLEARGRLKSAPPRMATLLSEATSSKSRPASSRSTVSAMSLSSSSSKSGPTSSRSSVSAMSLSSSNRGQSPKVNVFMTDTTSFDAVPLTNTTSPESTSSSLSLLSSRLVSPEHENDKNVSSETNSSVSLVRHHSNGSEKALCKRCGRTFNPAKNNDRACRWHRGPIVNLFGGTCMICGQLNFKRGCVTGYHLTG